MPASIKTVGETLTEGMRLLGRVWRRLIPPSFGAFILLGAATLATFRYTEANDFLDIVFTNPASLQDMPDAMLAGLMSNFLVAVAVTTTLQVIATGFVALAAYRLVDTELRGEGISAGEASRFAATRIVTLTLSVFVAIIPVFVGMVLFVVPGIWLAGMFAMAAPVIGFEGTGAIGALGRSYNLVKGRWWPTVGFLIVVGLLGAVAEMMVQLVALPLLAVGPLGAGTGLAFALTVVIQGFIVAAIAVMSGAWYQNLTAHQRSALNPSPG